MPTPVAIVPDALPKLYVSVCVKLLDALGVFMVTAEFIATLDDDTVGVVARGMVFSVMVPEYVQFTAVCQIAALIPTDTLLVPSVLWLTVILPEPIFCPLVMLNLDVRLRTVVPFIVTVTGPVSVYLVVLVPSLPP